MNKSRSNRRFFVLFHDGALTPGSVFLHLWHPHRPTFDVFFFVIYLNNWFLCAVYMSCGFSSPSLTFALRPSGEVEGH